MISQQQQKFLRSLQHKKYRDKEQRFIIEGVKLAKETLTQQPEIVDKVWLTQELYNELSPLLKTNCETHIVTPADIKKVSQLKSPQNILITARAVQNNSFDFSGLNDLCLILDTIQDPGNLGTLMRTADWFGIRHIICSHETADWYNPKVIQASMGAFLRVNMHYYNLSEFITNIPDNANVYTTSLKGDNLYNIAFGKPAYVVLGNESKGVREELLKIIPNHILIPRAQTSEHTTESLNVGIAGAIICNEFRRQVPLTQNG